MIISLQASLWDSMFFLSWNNHIPNYFKNKSRRTSWSIAEVPMLQYFYPKCLIWRTTDPWGDMVLLQGIPQSKCDRSILSRLNKYYMLLIRVYKSIHQYSTDKMCAGFFFYFFKMCTVFKLPSIVCHWYPSTVPHPQHHYHSAANLILYLLFMILITIYPILEFHNNPSISINLIPQKWSKCQQLGESPE